jgi:hypothetical protein
MIINTVFIGPLHLGTERFACRFRAQLRSLGERYGLGVLIIMLSGEYPTAERSASLKE